MRIFIILMVMVVVGLFVSSTKASYVELDDQSEGIAEGFGSWGAMGSEKETGVEAPSMGVFTLYHPNGPAVQRPTIFFISGWGQPAETYEKFFNFLVSHNYCVVNIYNYNPGNIESSYPNALAMMQQAANHYTTWIDTDAVGLMGHSFGGGAAIWLGQRAFGELNWGSQGKRFVFTTTPWLTFLTTRNDLEAYPADTKLHIQLSYDDLSSSAEYEWNTDPRAIRAVFELINIPSDEKDLITIYSDFERSYEFDGVTYTYDADHFVSYTGVLGGNYEPYDELDVYALNRLAHAMLEYVFEDNLSAKNVVLGNGHPDQVGMGLLPPLGVSDTPIITREENQFAYRCSESGVGTWGDPDIWKLQDFCEDADGDGIIDALDLPAVGVDDLIPAATTIFSIEPNPFNPRTTIRFKMKEPAQVSLKIYNVAGDLVRILFDENLSAGGHQKQWDGRDDSGRDLSSGTYIARLVSENIISSQSMVLIR